MLKDQETKLKTDTDTTVSSSFDDSSHRRRSRKRSLQVDLKCPLCEAGIKCLTYKDIYQLKKFTSVRGKIIASEKSGMCSKHQRDLRKSIQRARFMALLAYVAIDA